MDAYMQAVQVQLEATGSTEASSGSSSRDVIITSKSSSSSSSSSSVTFADAAGAENSTAAAAAAAVGSNRPTGFQPQGFINVLRVVAAWGQQPGPAWRASCLAAAERLLPQLGAEGSSTLLWAMAKLQVRISLALIISRFVVISVRMRPVVLEQAV
jgi:hypothetical protein